MCVRERVVCVCERERDPCTSTYKVVHISQVQCVSCRVNHSKNAIVKPQGPTPQEERREVEEAMKRIKEANKALATAVDTASNSGI